MVSEWAIWSGYQVDSDAFKTLMGIIRGSGDPDLDQDLLDDYALDYIRWRRCLPRKEAAQSPKIRFRALDPEVDKLTHIFFPIRFIPFKSDRQLNDPTHPDYPIAHEEIERTRQSWNDGSTTSTQNTEESIIFILWLTGDWLSGRKDEWKGLFSSL
ncbi:hypothetical protein F5878DRAFT_646146 [Lentinula raphanica]|uniref:Uncharacterized protein n=1 Tax=Lentinula raphanica TaxID=153919 RepID=A0AA38NYX0_9AGAR|nr:hypothetical protein F5878DRAFT_646146 [Lentinula raphanica]